MVKEKKSKSKSTAAKREPSPAPSASSSSSSSSSSGSDASDSEYSTTDTEEDDDGAQLTPAMDAAILRTLAKIKKGGAELYAGENVIQGELETARQAAEARGLKARTKAAEEQPFLLKDLHTRNLLEGGAPDSDDEGEEPMTFVQETRKARDDAVSAFAAFAGSDSEDEADALLVKREVAPEEAQADDAAYRAFLLEMGGGEDEVRRALGMGPAPLTAHREDSDDEDAFRAETGAEPEGEGEAAGSKKSKTEKKKSKKAKKSAEEKAARRAKADDEFLMDYILNRGWIERSDKAHVPTYEEIVGHERPADAASDAEAGDAPWQALSEDEEFEEAAEEFETQYNFRFEEPGATEIISHPRQIESLARRDDDKRKLKREARAERKAAEKAKREEETKRAKGEKRREMEAQLAALREELGGADVDWAAVEKVLEGEYDEGEWDRVVGEMLAKAAGESDDEKPAWDDDDGDYPMEDDGYEAPQAWEDTEEWAATADAEEDDGPINMDADFLEDEPKPKKLSKKEKKKAKAAAKQAAAAEDPEEDSKLSVAERAAKVKAAAESLKALDHEDQIGDLKTRFKYVKSSSSSFGLTPAEILLATDAELNELVSVKALAPYRRGGLGRAGYGIGKRVRDLKARLRDRKWGEEVDESARQQQKKEAPGGGGSNAIPLGQKKGDGEGRPGKRLGRKEREKLKAATGEEGEGEVSGVGEKRKRTESVSAAAPEPEQEAAEAEGGAGDGEKKKKRRKKKKAAAAAE